VNLVRREAGAAGVRRMLEMAGLGQARLAHLEDDASWSSFTDAKALFEAAVDVLGDEHALRRVGAAIARQDMTSEVVALLRTLGGPGEVLRHIDQVVPKFCTVVRMEADEVGEGFAVLSARNVAGFPRFALLCDFTAGLLEQAPLPFDLPPALVTEEACVLRGADRCVFRVMWEDRRHLAGPSDSIAALTAELDVLMSRFESFQQTASDLVATHDMTDLLDRIAQRAGLSVRAPRHVLAVRPSPHQPLQIHAEGCTPEEAEQLAAEIMAPTPDDRDGSRLIVDVASVQRTYGRLAAIYDEGLTFFPAERDLLASYARLAAAALDSATALAESRQQTATAQALLALARELARVGTEDEVADRLAHSVPTVVDAAVAGVCLWDGEGLRIVAVEGVGADSRDFLTSIVIRPDETPALAQLLDEPGPGFVGEHHEDSMLVSLLQSVGMRSVVYVPIRGGEQLLGVVAAAFDKDVQTLEDDPELMARLEGLADLAATALHNARLVERIQHQALYDPLTLLANKRLLEERINGALAARRRTGERFALLFVDLDRFKNVNDSLGHELGDALLVEVAERLRSVVRDDDTLARLGGDEFAILLPRIEDLEVPVHVADRVRRALELPFDLGGHRLFVTASTGIATAPDDGVDGNSLVKKADMALYRAKEQGRNRHAFYSPGLDSELSERLRMESDLHLALERDEFVVHYQPQISLSSMRIIGVEALVRWIHPELGFVGPDVFIPLAEESGLIVDIDRWVLQESCRQVHAWATEGINLRVAVNVSNRDLRDPEFVQHVVAALSPNSLAPETLELEVTERVVDAGERQVLDVLERLRELGVRLAIDDFGTGNSGLARLRNCPIQTLKIDKSFVQEVTSGEHHAPLLAAMIGLAHDLGLHVVAEGVETADQGAFLRRRSCDYAQGFYFSRPLLPKEVAALITR
jgi:diguanylate cyclase (GGDEF)-like protein